MEHRAPRAESPTADLPAIVIDSREQNPLVFPPSVRVVVAGLKTGDYSLEGFEDQVSLERKELCDLLACIGRERDRFQRELERLALLDYGAIVIEGTLADVLAGSERSLVSGRAAVGSLLAWSVDYRLPVFFAGDRRLAAALVLKVLAKWFEHRSGAEARPRPTRAPTRPSPRLLSIWRGFGGTGAPPVSAGACREAIVELERAIAERGGTVPEVRGASRRRSRAKPAAAT